MPTFPIPNGPAGPSTSMWHRIKVSLTTIFAVQGLYYLLTGVWPLLSLDSFEAVTGPKMEGWLVKTVGCLVLIEGAVFLIAAWRRSNAPEIIVLAVGSAIMLMLVDIIYVSERVIPAVYLLDAAAELVLILGWLHYLTVERRTALHASTMPPQRPV